MRRPAGGGDDAMGHPNKRVFHERVRRAETNRNIRLALAASARLSANMELLAGSQRRHRNQTMSNQWIDPNTCQSLAVLVESVTAPLLIEHGAPVCLEVEIDPSLDVPSDPTRTVELIRALVKQSLAEMPGGGELCFTACETHLGIELELADTGTSVESRATSLPMAAGAIGAQLQWHNCP